MPRAAAALLLALLLAGCTSTAPGPGSVQATVEVRFTSVLDAPVRVGLETANAEGERLDERTLQVPAFGSASALIAGRGPGPWHLWVRLPNGTVLEPTLDVAGGQRALTVYLNPDRVGMAPG